MTARQERWADAAAVEAARGNALAAGLFSLIAQPSRAERGHVCLEHSIGFRRDGRRGFKCGCCNAVLRWIDPA